MSIGTDLVVPPILLDVREGHFGEALEPTVENALAIKVEAKRLRQILRDAERMSDEVLLHHQRVHAQPGTFRVGGVEVKAEKRTEIQWDVDLLRELQKMGLPQHRWDELVTTTVEEKVSAVVAKQIAAANPEYGRVIEAARRTVEKPVYVRVTS